MLRGDKDVAQRLEKMSFEKVDASEEAFCCHGSGRSMNTIHSISFTAEAKTEISTSIEIWKIVGQSSKGVQTQSSFYHTF